VYFQKGEIMEEAQDRGETPNPQKPSIGRIVIFTFPEVQNFQNNNTNKAPAIIVNVWSDKCVNLKVLTDGVHDHWVTSVTKGDGPREWNWPPRV
jgi:hypothetical protein